MAPSRAGPANSTMSSRRADQQAQQSAARAFSQQARWARLACLALFIVLALIAVQCARLGVAGFLVQSAQDEVGAWTPAAPKPDAGQIRRATEYYSASLEYVHDNPWALEGLGAMDLARMRVSAIPREALAVTRSARARFRQALLQRPTSPFLWANLALAKLYLDEFDDEFMAALRHADELGPWEPTVQQTVLFAGLAAWQDLDAGLRQDLARAIERGAKRNTRRMFDIVNSYTRFDLVCAIEQYRLIAGPNCAGSALDASAGAPMKLE
jgi:hypothetical protein